MPFSDIIKFWERAKAGERKSFTYDEIDKSIENLWSVLFTTGWYEKFYQVWSCMFQEGMQGCG